MNSERRQNPRTKVAALAYINFEPNNGGIVLNVSEGGLCFHAVTPMQENGTLRFWFSAEGCRVEATGELAWTDETRKAGGLQFGILPAEVREQVRGWMGQCGVLPVPEKIPSRMIVSAHQAAQFRASQPETSARQRNELSAATSIQRPPANFFRGWVSGILTAALVAAVFFLNTHRRQVGESLIWLGERFAAKPGTQIALGAPPPTPALPSAPVPAPAVALAVAPAPIALARAESPPAARPVSRPDTSAITAMSRVAPPQAKPRTAARHTAISSIPPINSSRTPTPALESVPNAVESGKMPQPETPGNSPSDPPRAESASASRVNADAAENRTPEFGASAGKYFEVGEFRHKGSADVATNDAKALGVPVIVVHKGALWMNFYHVLAGPYRNQNEAESARSRLQSHGFKPRELPNKSRRFTLPLMTLYGTDVSVNDCTITWELYSPDATVTFVKGNTVVATAQGKWVKRNFTYKTNAVVARSNDRGLRTLLEIQCHGMDEALVFGATEPVRYFTPPPDVGL